MCTHMSYVAQIRNHLQSEIGVLIKTQFGLKSYSLYLFFRPVTVDKMLNGFSSCRTTVLFKLKIFPQVCYKSVGEAARSLD